MAFFGQLPDSCGFCLLVPLQTFGSLVLPLGGYQGALFELALPFRFIQSCLLVFISCWLANYGGAGQTHQARAGGEPSTGLAA